MGTTQNSTRLARLMANMAAVFGVGADPTALTMKGTPQFRNGTHQRKMRKKGKVNPAGSKIARMAREHRIGIRNPGGLCTNYFREKQMDAHATKLAASHGS